MLHFTIENDKNTNVNFVCRRNDSARQELPYRTIVYNWIAPISENLFVDAGTYCSYLSHNFLARWAELSNSPLGSSKL